MLPKIIYEDKNLIAVDKPGGILVHPARNEKPRTKNELTLVDFLLKKYPEIKNVGDDKKTRPGIVHRLDKDTSGVILVARNQKYFEYLKNLFQTHQIRKIYIALVWGEIKPKKGLIEKPIKIKKGTIKRTVWEGKMEKSAITTEYKVIKTLINADDNADKRGYINVNLHSNRHQSATFSLVEVYPKTGRTHQIRIHLSSIGHPIVGDKLYGLKNQKLPFNLTRVFLHARSLEFPLEEGKRIKIETDLPEDLKVVLKQLKMKKF